jgi:hypothetical protein
LEGIIDEFISLRAGTCLFVKLSWEV